jgi:hypothetical protein
MSIFGRDGIDIYHGWLSLYGWIILTRVWELVQAINLDMMDVCLNGYEIIIYHG